MRDPRVLWMIGAVMLIFCAVGLVAAATVVALPLYLVASLLGASQDTGIKVVLYSALLWAPIGFGAGVMTSGTLIRGIRRKHDPDGEN